MFRRDSIAREKLYVKQDGRQHAKVFENMMWNFDVGEDLVEKYSQFIW